MKSILKKQAVTDNNDTSPRSINTSSPHFFPPAPPSQGTPNKTVRFHEVCKVILIPMRQEYTALGIQLWYSKFAFTEFKKAYHQELAAQKAAVNAEEPTNDVRMTT